MGGRSEWEASFQMEAIEMSDTIILDSKKCNAELLTIHSDGRITVAEHLKPTETAAKVLQIMREQWMDNIQSKKIREQDDHIRRLEEAGDEAIYKTNLFDREAHWNKAKEAKP
jgi:polyphosphate kinase